MGYVLKAVLSSAQHPEYGQITVPFPIPDEKYDRMIELLEPLEIGDALRQDCRVDELDSFYTVLNRLVGSLVNFDELDYLAKRLDSFDDGEAAQFQGMACKLGVSNIKDFINLTFCCQQATVITDFSDLDAIGRQHYMTMQGGGCRIEELERLDGRKFALDLILNHLEGRITPYGVVYDSFCKNELTCIHYNGLTHAMIGWNANLYDLNLFAQRLASLTEEQKKGMDALLKIKQNHRVAPIPLNQLINLTYNTDICCFAPRVSNHEELGAFLYANEMLSNEAMALLDTTEEGSGFQERLLELLGEQHQEDHGGVFTDFGYAELGGEIKDIYVCQSNETACFHRSDAPVVLEVRKGFFNDPSYDNDKTAVLNLPAADAGIWRAVEKVDAASVDECAFRCVDCLIPFLRDAINNAIDDEDGIEQADEFAKRLAQIEREWPESDMVKYKALLSVVDHPSLQDATRLMGEIDQYELRPEVAQTWGYAEMMFREKYSALPEELFQTPQAAQIGQKMLDDRLGVITEYGLIRRKDGQPFPVFQPEQEIGQGLEMM